MTRTLALCADDFGLAQGVSAAISRLARRERLSAVGCVVNRSRWPKDAALLDGVPDSVDVGLHLNLTEGRPVSRRLSKSWRYFPTLRRLIGLAHLGALPRDLLRREVHAQVAAFVQAVGVPPKFIAGHQHVHHLPMVRDVVLDLAEHLQPLPALRSAGHVVGPGQAMQRWWIAASGGRALAAELERRALPHNPALLGIYGFGRVDYRALMQRWLAKLPAEGGLLCCHPGEWSADNPTDPIADARLREYAYLDGDAFLEDLRAADVVLGRVWRTLPLTRRISAP